MLRKFRGSHAWSSREGSTGEIPAPANAGGGVHGMAPPGPTAPDKLRSTPVASITPLNPGAFGPDSSSGLIESPIGCTEILQRLPVLRHHKLIDRVFSRRKGYSPFLKASHFSNLMLSRYRVTSAACAVYRSRARLFVVAGRSFAYWS